MRHWTPGHAATDPLFAWWTRFGDRQHAFRDGGIRSVCDGLRFTVLLERDDSAPICADCRRIVWSLTGSARDYIVDAEARADGQDTQLRMEVAQR